MTRNETAPRGGRWTPGLAVAAPLLAGLLASPSAGAAPRPIPLFPAAETPSALTAQPVQYYVRRRYVVRRYVVRRYYYVRPAPRRYYVYRYYR